MYCGWPLPISKNIPVILSSSSIQIWDKSVNKFMSFDRRSNHTKDKQRVLLYININDIDTVLRTRLCLKNQTSINQNLRQISPGAYTLWLDIQTNKQTNTVSLFTIYKLAWEHSFARDQVKENRMYIRVEFKQSIGMNFVSPFQPEREFKVYKSCKCSQIICSRVH